MDGHTLKLELGGSHGILNAHVCASGEMADAPDLGSGPVRGGGSSPLSRTNQRPQSGCQFRFSSRFSRTSVLCAARGFASRGGAPRLSEICNYRIDDRESFFVVIELLAQIGQVCLKPDNRVSVLRKQLVAILVQT